MENHDLVAYTDVTSDTENFRDSIKSSLDRIDRKERQETYKMSIRIESGETDAIKYLEQLSKVVALLSQAGFNVTNFDVNRW